MNALYIQGNRIEALYEASKYIITNLLPQGSWLCLISFDDDAYVLSGQFVQIDSNEARNNLVQMLPRSGSGGTCIGCGLLKALEVSSITTVLLVLFDTVLGILLLRKCS